MFQRLCSVPQVPIMKKFFNNRSQDEEAQQVCSILSIATSRTHSDNSGGVHVLSFTCLTFALAILVATCGCNKKESQTPNTSSENTTQASPAHPGSSGSDLRPVNPGDSAEVQEATRRAVLIAMRRGTLPPPPALKLKGGELATPEVLVAYNIELLRGRIRQGESPESLEQLVRVWIQTKRLLPGLPTPPAGKQIVYDKQNGIVRLDPP